MILILQFLSEHASIYPGTIVHWFMYPSGELQIGDLGVHQLSFLTVLVIRVMDQHMAQSLLSLLFFYVSFPMPLGYNFCLLIWFSHAGKSIVHFQIASGLLGDAALGGCFDTLSYSWLWFWENILSELTNGCQEKGSGMLRMLHCWHYTRLMLVLCSKHSDWDLAEKIE